MYNAIFILRIAILSKRHNGYLAKIWFLAWLAAQRNAARAGKKLNLTWLAALAATENTASLKLAQLVATRPI